MLLLIFGFPFLLHLDSKLNANSSYCIYRSAILLKSPLTNFIPKEGYSGSARLIYECALDSKEFSFVPFTEILEKYDSSKDSEDLWMYKLENAMYVPGIFGECFGDSNSKKCVVAKFRATINKPNPNQLSSTDYVNYIILVENSTGRFQKISEISKKF
jgi:hypothetical protein